MRSILKRLGFFARYCLKPEDSCATSNWLSADCCPELGGVLKLLVWLGLVIGAAVALF